MDWSYGNGKNSYKLVYGYKEHINNVSYTTYTIRLAL